MIENQPFWRDLRPIPVPTEEELERIHRHLPKGPLVKALGILLDACKGVADSHRPGGEHIQATLRNAAMWLTTGHIAGTRGVAHYWLGFKFDERGQLIG